MTESATTTPKAPDADAIDENLGARYGDAAPDTLESVNDVIALQLRHRSVRRFTPEDVSDDAITAIIAAAQSASTSSNLQSWSVIEIRDPERKAAAAELSGDQEFIRRAPVFLVFVADWARNRLIAEQRDAGTAGIDYLESTLVSFVDAGIAAQNAAIAAESLGLGITYVGSVRNNPLALSDLLDLPAGAFPVAGMAIGHPDPDDRAGIKPRLPQAIVRHRETYTTPSDSAIDAYDDALSAYYASQGTARAWTPTVLARVRDEASLRGRHVMREALEQRGLPSN
ncbi:nitroreductase family protein [Microbacterium aquimaris]|uniref:Nitroreductase family protein n=1 Tax=Microbacterium aquimaris TaxID=459816 RepID=A0ABU5N3D9_9MICO|nr:nitroreductase family protein [Microbacterium aquimaris]MDZ8160575.1 nitroreductase family protein [Microbacterium aquimaris]